MSAVIKVGIVTNFRSGRGKASQIGESISKYLQESGFYVRHRSTEKSYSEVFNKFLSEQDIVIIIGGDGSFRSMLLPLAEVQIPAIFVGTGNANLLSNGFGLPKLAADIHNLILNNKEEAFSFGLANNEPFFTMASLGPDAEVVKQVCLSRDWGSSNFSYVVGGLKALFSFQALSGTLTTEEEDITFSGSLVCARTPWYAGDLLPVAEASVYSDDLKIRVFNDTRNSGIFRWVSAILRRAPISLNNSKLISLSAGRLVLKSPVALQLDGDFLGEVSEVIFSVSPKKVRLLLPK